MKVDQGEEQEEGELRLESPKGVFPVEGRAKNRISSSEEGGLHPSSEERTQQVKQDQGACDMQERVGHCLEPGIPLAVEPRR